MPLERPFEEPCGDGMVGYFQAVVASFGVEWTAVGHREGAVASFVVGAWAFVPGCSVVLVVDFGGVVVHHP